MGRAVPDLPPYDVTKEETRLEHKVLQGFEASTSKCKSSSAFDTTLQKRGPAARTGFCKGIGVFHGGVKVPGALDSANIESPWTLATDAY